jgi:hypothetical protein
MEQKSNGGLMTYEAPSVRVSAVETEKVIAESPMGSQHVYTEENPDLVTPEITEPW